MQQFTVRNVQPAANTGPFTASLHNGEARIATIRRTPGKPVHVEWKDETAAAALKAKARAARLRPEQLIETLADESRTIAVMRKRMLKVMRTKKLFFVGRTPHAVAPDKVAEFKTHNPNAKRVGDDIDTESAVKKFAAFHAPKDDKPTRPARKSRAKAPA